MCVVRVACGMCGVCAAYVWRVCGVCAACTWRHRVCYVVCVFTWGVVGGVCIEANVIVHRPHIVFIS